MYQIRYYQNARGDRPVHGFIKELDVKTRAKINWVILRLETMGPNLIRPYADVVRGKIRELRIEFGHNNVRILYFFFDGDQIVLVHAFLKKTDAIRLGDIELAERRMTDWIRWHSN